MCSTPAIHRRLAQIGLRIGGPYGFALAGGHAIAAHGILERPSEDVDLFAVASNQRGHYARINAAFLALRADDQNDLIVGANWRFAKDWTFKPQWVHSRNKSNIDLYSYERDEVSFTVRRDFN